LQSFKKWSDEFGKLSRRKPFCHINHGCETTLECHPSLTYRSVTKIDPTFFGHMIGHRVR